MKNHPTPIFTRILRAVFAALLAVAALSGCAADSSVAQSDDDSPSEQTVLSASEPEPTAAVATLPPVSLTKELPGASDFAILFVNVGKADAAILQFGETAVLIDTGSAASTPQLIAGLNALNVSAIDAVFITHSHSDHLGGLSALAANYQIPVVYSPLLSEQNKDGEGKIVKRAEQLGLEHRELQAGERVAITSDVSFLVLGPLELNEEDDNDNSLVLRFTYGATTFLFTGDMQFAEEQTLMDAGADLKSDVLKVGNHGNPDATGELFGALVSPAYAVVSTSTLQDPDSANARVVAALPTAKVYVTQNFTIGLLLTLDGAGSPVVSNPAAEGPVPEVAIQNIDADQQTVTLVNSGSTEADLSGCVLYCSRTDALLRFPDGTILSGGQTLTVGSGGDFVFPGEDKPLNKKKTNTVTLYSDLGVVIGELTQSP